MNLQANANYFEESEQKFTPSAIFNKRYVQIIPESHKLITKYHEERERKLFGAEFSGCPFLAHPSARATTQRRWQRAESRPSEGRGGDCQPILLMHCRLLLGGADCQVTLLLPCRTTHKHTHTRPTHSFRLVWCWKSLANGRPHNTYMQISFRLQLID